MFTNAHDIFPGAFPRVGPIQPILRGKSCAKNHVVGESWIASEYRPNFGFRSDHFPKFVQVVDKFYLETINLFYTPFIT